jgi:uncharacterized delta-60 repeat protein
MAFARPFAYNLGTPIPGTEQVGSLAIGFPTSGITNNPQFWNGPDEQLGYVIAAPVSGNTQPTPIPGVFASLKFYRTSGFSDGNFINLAQAVSRAYGTPQIFLTASAASTWLTNNGFWNSFINFCYEVGEGFNNQAEAAVEDSSGRIIFGGLFTSYSGVSFNRIVRVNSDASIDNTFNIGTGFNNAVTEVVLQPDGKIIVGGVFSSYNGTPANDIIRLNSDGTVDNTFSAGTGFNEIIWAIDVQPDGKILVGGFFSQYNGVPYNCLIRLNSNGSVDNSFTIGTGFNNTIYDIKRQVDGKYIIFGSFTTFNGVTCNRIVRLNNDGSIDNTFNTGVGFNGETYSGLIDDGKIVVAGEFFEYSGQTNRNIVRLNINGSIDDTFNSNSGFSRTSGPSYTLSVLNYLGKYYITGDFNTYEGGSSNGLIRLNNDGSIDPTFNVGTGLDFSAATDNLGLLLSNGVHVVFGQFSEYKGSVVNDIAFINQVGTLLNCPL